MTVGIDCLVAWSTSSPRTKLVCFLNTNTSGSVLERISSIKFLGASPVSVAFIFGYFFSVKVLVIYHSFNWIIKDILVN